MRHGPEVPWVVTESAPSMRRQGKGGKGKTFRAAPCHWFSCSQCATTGTLTFLREVLSRRSLESVKAFRQCARPPITDWRVGS